MSPGGGNEVVLVTGKMSDVKLQLTKKVYRIKGIPVQQEQLEVKQVL
jgi:hypothetical protein